MSDQTARDTALETTRSFIVQAPAGSGKTELLIQRYLALLANVETPEQIVAITFTRKAAAEMRARALRALRAAEEELPVDEPHQQRTRDLALGVLSRGQQLDWHLIAQPQRLRIDTLDALNAWLAQQLPVLAGGVSGATVVERADELYAVATRRVLEELGTSDEIGGRLQALLERLDNRVGRLESLLAELLPRREQWLPYLVSGSDEELRTGLEHALDCLVSEELERVAAKIPPASIPKVIAVLRHAAGFATDESFATVPSDWPESLDSLPTSTAQLDSWQALADLLLIKSCKWRTQLPAKLGFGVDHPDERNRLIDLIAALQPENGLLEELHGLRSLPNARYEETQWQVLADLRVVLLRLAGMLRVVFAERNCVDFAEVAAAAEQALGAIDQPSELLLALDYRIQHILVDEFQDTSHSQSRLLELLTAGWQPGDGRTLFLVGDPMQSIYRFRNADMSLFLKVKAHGVGDIRCESLTLSRNFRSRPAVIDWVNRIFPSIFPDEDDMSAGAARFYPCESVKDSAENSQVRFHALTSDNPQVEVEKVIELLTEERESHPRDSVAILVKSRSHLAGLHDQLRARRIDAHAVELEPPSEREAVQDLLGLTRALLHPADRIAWLAVLRAPWCGLTWADLNALVEQDPNRSVWDLMNSPERTASLSEDGRVRLENCRHALQGAAECRAQQPLSRWVERTWVTLGGPACLNS
ncbi:MAG: UvrD-helicase domain-containing protein, partial [Candidatus Rariloculaceae bacterium]